MKVLIIDDEPLVRRSLSRAFKARGHEVTEAVDGQDGLQQWRDQSPDIVLLDVLMPRLTGPQVLQKIGKDRCGKVILISAYSGDDSFATVSEAGADKFIAKPFSDIFQVVEIAESL